MRGSTGAHIVADGVIEPLDGHYRAAILLARSVIEATAKDKGITTGNLKSKIEEMANQQVIRPHIKAVADGIRDYRTKWPMAISRTRWQARTRR